MKISQALCYIVQLANMKIINKMTDKPRIMNQIVYIQVSAGWHLEVREDMLEECLGCTKDISVIELVLK